MILFYLFYIILFYICMCIYICNIWLYMYIYLNLFQTIPASSWLSAKNNPVAPNNQTDRRSLTPPPLQDLLRQGLQLSHVLDVIWMFTPICHLCLGHHGYNGGVYIGWLGNGWENHRSRSTVDVFQPCWITGRQIIPTWCLGGPTTQGPGSGRHIATTAALMGNDRGTKRGCGEKETWKATLW